MVEVTGIRFKEVGKIYYFDFDGLSVKNGDHVIVETSRGIEYGTVVIAKKQVTDDEIVPPLKKILRIANEKDEEAIRKNKEMEREAFQVCQEKIRNHNLEMKLIDVEYTFDHNKVLFYFTADGRVDFRELVRDLAGVLSDFAPVSIKMAKEQNLSLNPAKISGTCGRLMCCLKNEQEAYEEIAKNTPGVGSVVKTPDGTGTVTAVSPLKGIITVSLENGDERELKEFKVDKVKIIKRATAKNDENVDMAELKKLEKD